jgi:hypothetical protein
MTQAELDQAKVALADGYVGRARNLIEAVIADCKILNLELQREKGTK